MPTPFREQPEFSPVGRYLIDVLQRAGDRNLNYPSYFHDTDNFKEDCGIESIPTGSVSRFNNMKWSIQRGFLKCPFCLESEI